MLAACKYTNDFETCINANHHFIMGVRSKLSPEKGAQIVAFREAGFSKRRIAADLRYNQPAIRDAILRFRETGFNKDRPHWGGPPCSTPAQDRFLASIACRNRFRTPHLLKGHWQHALGRVASTSNARKARARCPTALEWYDSPWPESPLSANAPVYPFATPYAWLSYQILISEILWINWNQYFNKEVVFLVKLYDWAFYI